MLERRLKTNQELLLIDLHIKNVVKLSMTTNNFLIIDFLK